MDEKSLKKDCDVKAVKTLDEAVKLLEDGWEYITDMNGAKIFRKRVKRYCMHACMACIIRLSRRNFDGKEIRTQMCYL